MALLLALPHIFWDPSEKPANGVWPRAQPGRTRDDLTGQRLLGDRGVYLLRILIQTWLLKQTQDFP